MECSFYHFAISGCSDGTMQCTRPCWISSWKGLTFVRLIKPEKIPSIRWICGSHNVCTLDFSPVILSSPDKMIEICRIFCGAASRKHSNIRTRATSLSSSVSFLNQRFCSGKLLLFSARLHLIVYTKVLKYLQKCQKWRYLASVQRGQPTIDDWETHRKMIGKITTDQDISKMLSFWARFSLRSSKYLHKEKSKCLLYSTAFRFSRWNRANAPRIGLHWQLQEHSYKHWNDKTAQRPRKTINFVVLIVVVGEQ